MCKTCWTVAGSPYDLPENAAEIVDAINDLYDLPDCGAGGPLHVQLDDWNADWSTPLEQLKEEVLAAARALVEHEGP